MIICKFGGSSVADEAGAKKIKEILKVKNCKIIVVSALGKCDKFNYKITDKLFELYFAAVDGNKYLEIVDEIFERHEIFCEKLNVKINWKKYKTELIKHLSEKDIDKNFIVSRGEYYSALIYAKYLNANFLDAKNYIKFNKNKKINKKLTKKALINVNFKKTCVIGGYYGGFFNGQICTFDRGGSDITGALICDCLGCELYENYTDVNGVYTKNPNIFRCAKQMPILSFKTAIRMAECGNEIVHKDALSIMKKSGKLLLIKNTKKIKDCGSIVVNENVRNGEPYICVDEQTCLILNDFNKDNLNYLKTICEISFVVRQFNKYFIFCKKMYVDESKLKDVFYNLKIIKGRTIIIFSDNIFDLKMCSKINKIKKNATKLIIFSNFLSFFNNFLIFCKNEDFEHMKKVIEQYLQ